MTESSHFCSWRNVTTGRDEREAREARTNWVEVGN